MVSDLSSLLNYLVTEWYGYILTRTKQGSPVIKLSSLRPLTGQARIEELWSNFTVVYVLPNIRALGSLHLAYKIPNLFSEKSSNRRVLFNV